MVADDDVAEAARRLCSFSQCASSPASPKRDAQSPERQPAVAEHGSPPKALKTVFVVHTPRNVHKYRIQRIERQNDSNLKLTFGAEDAQQVQLCISQGANFSTLKRKFKQQLFEDQG